MNKAMIFDIVRNSYVDGPGIRTTVFLKGCNLKCAWCHNPESQSANKQMLFYKNKCTGCGKCAANCPVGNIGMSEGKPKFGGKCVMCARCSFYCPADAISIGLLNGWKVNGAYDFDGKQKDVSGKMPEFLKIAYEKYFQKAEEKIALLNASQPAKFSFDVQEEDSSADMTVKNNH